MDFLCKYISFEKGRLLYTYNSIPLVHEMDIEITEKNISNDSVVMEETVASTSETESASNDFAIESIESITSTESISNFSTNYIYNHFY